MTPELCLISIPHSGTRVLSEVFLRARPKWHELGYTSPPHQTPCLFQGHCMKMSQVNLALDLAKRMPLIAPLRHPYRIEESWRRRAERNVDDLPQTIEIFIEHIAPRAYAICPVDGSPLTRAIGEEQIRDAAGRRDLPFDWDVVVNSKGGTHDLPLSACNPSRYIMELRKHPFFTPYYGQGDPQ